VGTAEFFLTHRSSRSGERPLPSKAALVRYYRYSVVTDWRAGDVIPIAAGRSLRVVGIVARAEDEPPVLIVEDA
jgi:hypothetical protein